MLEDSLESKALSHLDKVQNDIYFLVGRRVVLSGGKVSICTESKADGIEVFRALQRILGENVDTWTEEDTLNRIKEEKAEWQKEVQSNALKLMERK